LKVSRNRHIRKAKLIRWSGLVGLMVVLIVVVAVTALFAREKGDDEKWAEKTITSLASAQSFDENKGLSNREETITRGQAATLISELMQLETKSENVFMDLDEGFYTDGILKMVAVNGMRGDKDKKIYPKSPLTVESAIDLVAVIVEDNPSKETKDDLYRANEWSRKEKDRELTAGEFMAMLDNSVGDYYATGGKIENKRFQKTVLVSCSPVEFCKCKFQKNIRSTKDISPEDILLTGGTGGSIKPIGEGHNLNKNAPYDFCIASYDTKFDPEMKNRSDNLKRALSSLDGTVVKPGSVFSFNQTTGKKSYERGYKDGIVVSGGKLVPGLAGGVCQVSSTVWNAAIESGVEVLERHAHDLEFSYVPPGRDATVYDGVHDLRFKNTYPVPIMIRTNYDKKGVITVGIYAQGYVKKPEIEIITTKLGEYKYLTKRKVDGKVDYEHMSKYGGFGF
jgi:hypothetical protein